jgi:hypothetical protein
MSFWLIGSTVFYPKNNTVSLRAVGANLFASVVPLSFFQYAAARLVRINSHLHTTHKNNSIPQKELTS